MFTLILTHCTHCVNETVFLWQLAMHMEFPFDWFSVETGLMFFMVCVRTSVLFMNVRMCCVQDSIYITVHVYVNLCVCACVCVCSCVCVINMVYRLYNNANVYIHAHVRFVKKRV